MEFASAHLARLVDHARPDEFTWLLLRVVLGGNSDAAMAWQEWSAASKGRTASQAEERLFPSVAEKLTRLGISHGTSDALLAARRSTFIANQARLTAIRPLLEQLSAAVPTMMLKGGARIAGNPKDQHLRVIRDVDLLFRPGDLSTALEIAISKGYRSIPGPLPGPVKSAALAPLPIAGQRKADYFEIDFHCVPLRLGRTGFHDEGLWQRSTDGQILGVPVRVPSASDRFLHAIAHGLVADDDKPADWIVDAAGALRDGSFDPEVVAREIHLRRLGVAVGVASRLLGELGLEVPKSIIEACNRDCARSLYRREFVATSKPTRSQSLIERSYVFAAEWLRSSRSRARIRSWKTVWLALPSIRRPSADWSHFVAGRADLSLKHVQDDSMTIRFAGIPKARERLSFDVLLEGLWIGRIRFRWLHRFAPQPFLSWRARMKFRLPAGLTCPDPARLTVVALDDRKMPTADTSREMSVTLETP